jgi:hypothetical protein
MLDKIAKMYSVITSPGMSGSPVVGPDSDLAAINHRADISSPDATVIIRHKTPKEGIGAVTSSLFRSAFKIKHLDESKTQLSSHISALHQELKAYFTVQPNSAQKTTLPLQATLQEIIKIAIKAKQIQQEVTNDLRNYSDYLADNYKVIIEKERDEVEQDTAGLLKTLKVYKETKSSTYFQPFVSGMLERVQACNSEILNGKVPSLFPRFNEMPDEYYDVLFPYIKEIWPQFHGNEKVDIELLKDLRPKFTQTLVLMLITNAISKSSLLQEIKIGQEDIIINQLTSDIISQGSRLGVLFLQSYEEILASFQKLQKTLSTAPPELLSIISSTLPFTLFTLKQTFEGNQAYIKRLSLSVSSNELLIKAGIKFLPLAGEDIKQKIGVFMKELLTIIEGLPAESAFVADTSSHYAESFSTSTAAAASCTSTTSQQAEAALKQDSRRSKDTEPDSEGPYSPLDSFSRQSSPTTFDLSLAPSNQSTSASSSVAAATTALGSTLITMPSLAEHYNVEFGLLLKRLGFDEKSIAAIAADHELFLSAQQTIRQQGVEDSSAWPPEDTSGWQIEPLNVPDVDIPSDHPNEQ